jgi:site-specific DNA-methyltransferase (adenine-specific)
MSGYMPKTKSDNWITPPKLYDELNKEFKFNFDPCPITWKEGDPDGLSIDWGSSTFCNPPYSKVALWIKKAYDEWKKGKKIVMLINVITDTKAFHEYIYNKAELRFIKGRISFIDPNNPTKKQPNVKASMLVIFK